MRRIEYRDSLAYITGGTSGIGFEVARQLAKRGARLVVFARKASAEALAELQTAAGDPRRVRYVSLDIADRDQVLRVLAQTMDASGVPELLFHSAGLGVGGEFLDMPFETWDRVQQVNVYGTRNLCEAVAPRMVARGSGQIALVGSMGGFISIFGYTDYATSKFAVRGFADALRYELEPHGVAVSLICPGEVDTPLVAAERQHIHPATRAIKDTGGLISTAQCAREALAGLSRRRAVIIPGAQARLTYYLHHLMPDFLWRAVLRHLVRGASVSAPSADRQQSGPARRSKSA